MRASPAAGSGKTNAVRMLEGMGVAFDLAAYDPGDGHVDAAEVARTLGVPPEELFKTLVARDDEGGIRVYCVPAAADLDLKKAARASRVKRIDLVPLKDLQPLTGYVRGGVTVFGCKKDYPVVVDELIELFDQVSVSAGVRGTQILIAPSDYLRASRAKVAPIARDQR